MNRPQMLFSLHKKSQFHQRKGQRENVVPFARNKNISICVALHRPLNRPKDILYVRTTDRPHANNFQENNNNINIVVLKYLIPSHNTHPHLQSISLMRGQQNDNLTTNIVNVGRTQILHNASVKSVIDKESGRARDPQIYNQ